MLVLRPPAPSWLWSAAHAVRHRIKGPPPEVAAAALLARGVETHLLSPRLRAQLLDVLLEHAAESERQAQLAAEREAQQELAAALARAAAALPACPAPVRAPARVPAVGAAYTRTLLRRAMGAGGSSLRLHMRSPLKGAAPPAPSVTAAAGVGGGAGFSRLGTSSRAPLGPGADGAADNPTLETGSGWRCGRPRHERRHVRVRLAPGVVQAELKRAGVLLFWVLAFLVGFNAGGMGFTAAFFTATASQPTNSFTAAAGFGPTSLSAVAVSGTGVTLSWTAPAGGWATGYTVQRGTTSGSYTTTNPTGCASLGAATTTCTDSSVSSGVTYYYAVRATSANGGTGTLSNEASATVQSAPTNLTATAATNGSGSVTLAWDAYSGATSYNVLRSVTSGSGYTQIGTSATTSYADSAVSNAVKYFYVVQAVTGTGTTGNSNEASAIADSTGPSVAGVTPQNGLTNVPVSANVAVTFSEAMSQANTSFSISPGGFVCSSSSPTGGTCAWSTDGKTLTFNPTSALSTSTTYTVTVTTTSAKDVAGNALTADSTTTFTTAASTTNDTTAPTLSSVSPANGTSNVGTNTDVVITFSEAMDTGATQAAFCLYPSSGTCAANQISGIFIWSNANATLTYDIGGRLDGSTAYTVAITAGTGGAADLSGNVLVAASCSLCSTSFTTAADVGPTIVFASPADSQAFVDNQVDVIFTFSEAMNTTSVVSNFCLFQDNPSGSGSCATTSVTTTATWSSGNTTVQFTPSGNLSTSSRYRFTLSTSATNTTGTPLSSSIDRSFTTGSGTSKSTNNSSSTRYPGGKISISGTNWPASTERVEARWDATNGAIVGSVGTCGGGTHYGDWTIDPIIVPFTATVGGHTIWLIGYKSGCVVASTGTTGITVSYPDAVTISSSDANNKLNPSSCGATCPEGKTATLTFTVKKDGSPVGTDQAGVVFSLVTNPSNCAGGSLSQTGTSSLPLRTDAAGQVTTTLTACTSVFIDMTVSGATGNGLTASSVFSDPPVPPPDTFTLSVGSIRVDWEPSPNPLVTGYMVYLGTKSGVYDREYDAGNATSYTIKDVTPGTTYYVVLRSYNEKGYLSDPTVERSLTIPLPTATPTPTLTPSLTPATTATATAVLTPSLSPTTEPSTSTPTATGTGTPTITPTGTATATGTATGTVAATETATPSRNATATSMAAGTAAGTPLAMSTLGGTASPAGTGTVSASPTGATGTPTPGASAAASITPTVAGSPAASATGTLDGTAAAGGGSGGSGGSGSSTTAPGTPSATPTPTPTPTPSGVPAPASPTATASGTASTGTPTPTAAPVPSSTGTTGPTGPTGTPLSSATAAPTAAVPTATSAATGVAATATAVPPSATPLPPTPVPPTAAPPTSAPPTSPPATATP